MKKIIALTLLAFFSVQMASASVYLKYYNKDSKTYTFEVKIAGSTKKVEFGSSRTAAVTIQGGSEIAEIKTSCGWQKVNDDDKIVIKNGCITIE